MFKDLIETILEQAIHNSLFEAKVDKVQPSELKKKFSDRKDKDIDNDGDVDSSDEYLHKRRQAISKAMKNEGCSDEEIEEEQIDELSKKTLGSYIKKAAGSAAYEDNPSKRLKGIIKATDRLTKESVELDESFPRGIVLKDKPRAGQEIETSTQDGKSINLKVHKLSLLKNKMHLSHPKHGTAVYKKGNIDGHWELTEEVELDEISSDLKSRYAKKAQTSLKRATTYKDKAKTDLDRANKRIDFAYTDHKNRDDEMRSRKIDVDKEAKKGDKAISKIAKHDSTIAKRTAGLKRANEEARVSDLRVGDSVYEVGSKLKGRIIQKGNRDEFIVKFGNMTNKTIPASKLRLAEG